MPSTKCDQIRALVTQMQTIRAELPEAEGKDARRGLPQRIYESLSGLSNRRGGGVIIFGVEDASFRPVGGLDIARLQESLCSFVDQKMSYPIRLDFAACDVGGQQVLAAFVPEAGAAHKPVYYLGKGIIGGSYLRVGNTNHVLSDPEVRAILRASERDDTDTLPVEDASISDLSPELVGAYLDVVRARNAASALLGLGKDDLLLAIRAAVRVGEHLVPTQAGLLFFSTEPQRWLPNSFLSFMQFPGTEIASGDAAQPVYVDNVRISGPLPQVIEGARARILSRIRKRALLQGFARREIPEYPDWAYREAVVNAVAHRDYGITGAHIQVRLFADRLEVQSPGGLFRTVSEQNIEHEQSTRNHVIVRLLEEFGLVEQRGIGINRMVQAMLAAGLERPVFRDSLTSFLVVLKNHTMMDDEAYEWLSGFADYVLTDRQRTALVYAWRTGALANRDYQRLNSVTSVRATRDLHELVQAGLLDQHGTRGAAFYSLSQLPSRRRRRPASVGRREQMILSYVRRQGRITNSEGRQLLGITSILEMLQILRRMVRYSLLVQRGPSKKDTYYELGPAAGRSPGAE